MLVIIWKKILKFFVLTCFLASVLSRFSKYLESREGAEGDENELSVPSLPFYLWFEEGKTHMKLDSMCASGWKFLFRIW